MKHLIFLSLSLWSAFAYSGSKPQTEFLVAQDGTGDYKSIQQAILATKAFPPERITLKLKNGVYREKVRVYEWNTLLTLEGESMDKTIITFDDHFKKLNKGRNSTFLTPTVQVDADDFIAKNITIRNTAGDVGQAVALAVNANRALFAKVRLEGNQDTLYVTGDGNKMLFTNCYIEGTTDFIFGEASALFNNCTLVAKKDSYITAASTRQGAGWGLVFLNAKLEAKKGVSKVYLGRPWRPFANTVFINAHMGAHIAKEGWHNWGKIEAQKTAYYAEYGTRGAGENTKARVPWSHSLSKTQAQAYGIDRLLYSKVKPNWFLFP